LGFIDFFSIVIDHTAQRSSLIFAINIKIIPFCLPPSISASGLFFNHIKTIKLQQKIMPPEWQAVQLEFLNSYHVHPPKNI